MTATGIGRSDGSAYIIAIRVVIAVLLLTGVAGVVVSTGIDLVWFRDVGYPDSASLLRMSDYSRDGTIYPDPDQPPYLVSLYGPLFYILLSLPSRLANHNIETARMLVRITVAGFWVAGLFLVFLIVYRISGSLKKGAFAMLLACAPHVIAHWTTQVRGDFLGIAFSLLSIYFVLAAPNYRNLAAGGVCSVLALLCKQTFVAAPVAVLVYLLWRRRFAYALTWCAVVGLGTSLGYGILMWREPYAWRELTALSHALYDVPGGIRLGAQGLWNGATLFALLGTLAAWRKSWGTELLLLLYCLLTWFVALTSIFQAGGSTNYFLEPLTASAVLAASTLHNVEKAAVNASRVILTLGAVGLLCFFFPLLQADLNLLEDSRFRIVNYAAFRNDWKSFIESVAGRPLLSSYPDVTIYSKTPQVPDTLLNTVLAQRGVWSWNPVLVGLNRHDYELLAMYPYFLRGSGQYRGIRYWNSAVFEAILRNYELAGLCAGMEIWTPRNAGPQSWKYLRTEGCR
jgi:hypothetical protein